MSAAAPILIASAQAIGLVVCLLAAAQVFVQAAQLAVAAEALALRRTEPQAQTMWRRSSEISPPISVLAPAYNEEKTVIQSVKSLLALRYPEFEIIVINDGSTDGTLQALCEAFELVPANKAHANELSTQPVRGIFTSTHQARLIVIDKENGGKADALNAGINVSSSPIVCAIDADSLLEGDALIRAVQPFIDEPDETVAVGGSIRVINGCLIESGAVARIGLPTNRLAMMQVVEYLRAFMLARLAWSHIGALTIISGAFGLFRKDLVTRVGGYSLSTVGEDMELIFKLHRYCRDARMAYRIAFAPDPICWTQVPETLSDLGRQRSRWQRGSLETFAKHADAIFRRRYGRVGGLAMANILITDVLGPTGEFLGYCVLPVFSTFKLLSWDYLFAFLALSVGLNMAISVFGIVLDQIQQRFARSAEELVSLVSAAVLENLGYRQICNLWRVVGTIQFLMGETGWGTMNRRTF